MPVNVEFSEGGTTEEIVSKVSQLFNPHIVLWYVGSYGLKKEGAHFYRDSLISPIFDCHPSAKFWLVDLTAWGAFKNPNCSISKSHSCCDLIEEFSDNRIRCIRTSEIFKKLINITDENIVDYFNEALNRKFICQASKKLPPINITVKSVFQDGAPLVEQWQHYDTNHAYSIFQYLEGCLLIEEIFTQCMENGLKKIKIVFGLPNDELKYYQDELGSFQKDIQFLISNHFKKVNINDVNLDIQFFSFKYGSQIDHRPYNAPGQVLKSNKLLYSDVISKKINQDVEEFQYATN